MKILVIDDEPIILDLTADCLEDEGHDVVLASSGKEGLKLFFQTPEAFHAILTDIKMPGMDGFGLLNEVRKHHFTTPVILMSAHVDEEITTQAQDLGALACLFKPFKFSELFVILDQCES